MTPSDPEQLMFQLDDLFTSLGQVSPPTVHKTRRKRAALESVSSSSSEVTQYLQDISLDLNLNLPNRKPRNS